ncbi:hypothetical protein [Kordia sp.]|uniref:hypothetical protein n=1 Tax=Kordia sp. TaxID=1965332 RepID=UPI003D6B9CD2
MKVINFTMIVIVVVVLSLLSCDTSTHTQPADAIAFNAIEKVMKSEFGENACYTNLTISYNKTTGSSINTIVTNAPKSLKMEKWNSTQNIWKKTSDIFIEVPNGTKAKDFMFQLNDTINLSTLGDLVEKSSKQLQQEKNIEKPALHLATIKFPKNGDVSKTEYCIMLKPENGDKTFSFFYSIDGKLIKMYS